VPGALLAAVLIGELHAFGIVLFPKITLVLIFLVMAVVLVVRPYGLLGRPPASAHAGVHAVEPVIRPTPRILVWIGLAVCVALALLPIFAGAYALGVVAEIAMFVLFAASLHFMMGPGGMASFGHAAYFGLGAYGAALAAKYLGAPMLGGLALAPLAAGLAGIVFGWFCVRLSGVYLAMLTLAFAQISWSVVFQWDAVTGGDNGLLGIWPSDWARDPMVYYYLALVICVGATLLLRRMIYAPFGYALRAGRDSALRAEAIGIDVTRTQWAAFAVAALFAGLAGGLFAYFKGSVFPTYISIPKSVDALLMVLLGGVRTVSGPIIGAVVFAGLEEQLLRWTEYWRSVLGAIIVVLVLAFPQGIAGFVAARALRDEETPA
jgi:branched-chain amino acid transport system permease protein